MQTVGVVFGGQSNEHEISVITGLMAANLLKTKMDVVPLYIKQNGEIVTGDLLKLDTFRKNDFKKCKPAVFCRGGIMVSKGKKYKFVPLYCVLNCCHGGWGEGGGLAGVSEAAQIPSAGADVFSSSVFMDKYLTKLLLAGLGVKTAKYALVRRGDALPKVQYPAIVKPCTLGSSIGVAAVKDEEELKEALACAFIYDCAAIVEEYLSPRREINCAALRSDGKVIVSECEEAVTEGDILSFEDKYQGGGKSIFPAQISAENSTRIRETTRFIYESLNMNGIVRFDYIICGDVYLSEVNTVPGSLSWYLFSKDLKGFAPILEGVVHQAVKNFQSDKKRVITTGILADLPSNACKLPNK